MNIDNLSSHVLYHIQQGELMSTYESEGRLEKSEQMRNQGLIRMAVMSNSELIELAEWYGDRPGHTASDELRAMMYVIANAPMYPDRLTEHRPFGEISSN